MKLPRTSLAALVAALVLVGCAPGPDITGARVPSSPRGGQSVETSVAPEPEVSPTVEDSPDATAQADASLADVRSVKLKDGCTAESGLVDGFPPVFFDFNGDGADEALAVFHCGTDEKPEPDRVVLIGPGGRVLDEKSLDEAIDKTKGRVREFKDAGDGKVELVVAGDALEHGVTVTVEKGDTITFEVRDPFHNAVLSLSGFGPVKLGMRGNELVGMGFGIDTKEVECPAIVPSKDLEERGIRFTVEGLDAELWDITTEDPKVRTPSGAYVGMSEAELKKAYGEQLQSGDGPDSYYVEISERTMAFGMKDGKVARITVYDAPWSEAKLPRGYC